MKFHSKTANLAKTKYIKTGKRFAKTMALSSLITFISLAIVGVQIFYPFHIVVGVSLYLISFLPLVKKLYVSRNIWLKHKVYKKTTKLLKKEKRIIIIFVILSLLAMVYLILRPTGGQYFDDKTDQEIISIVRDDLYKSVTAIDYLETAGGELLASLNTDDEDSNTTEEIEDKFNEFLSALILTEYISDVHRHFDDIPYRLWDERVTSFAISYSLYVKKYEILHRVMLSVSGSEYKKKVLNQYVELYDRDKIYAEMVSRFYSPGTRLRISAGWLYLRIFGSIDTVSSQDSFELLKVKSEEGYQYLFKNFDQTLLASGEIIVDTTRNEMFDMWLPVQRGVANAMGRTILSTRGKEYLINDELIREMKKVMLPGDVMLQRRNWHLSNVGIPGFWTHAALHTGTLEEMDNYFASEFPYEGHDSISSYIEVNFPDVYQDKQMLDTDSNAKSVIEAIEPGVVLQSLEKSAHADFVVTLRPNLEKKDKMLALFRAFGSFGKPYDYNFDFDTRDALVCSELIFDAYFESLPYKQGISLEISEINGRKVVSPLDIAKKYKKEDGSENPEFSFVYLIVGDEESGSARVSNREEFLESVDWNKFSFTQGSEDR